jgi:hypothetical protein
MITVLVKNAQQAMELKDRVLAAGLVLHQDFTWAYQPDAYDGWDESTRTQPMVQFVFADPVQETFFRMKFE